MVNWSSRSLRSSTPRLTVDTERASYCTWCAGPVTKELTKGTLRKLPCPVPGQTQTTCVHVVLLLPLFLHYPFHSLSLLSVSFYLVISLTKLRSLFFINKSKTNLHSIYKIWARPTTPAHHCQGSPAPHGAPGLLVRPPPGRPLPHYPPTPHPCPRAP